jgi:LacI family transcriptional regulator
MKQQVTLKDVAREAGVSAQTVSRVVNHRPDVSPQTRARVKAAIAKLGYSPNVIARSLIKGHSNTLGVIGYGLGLFGPTRVLAGIERKANELGFSLLLCLLHEFDPERMAGIVASLLSRRVDGIIWAVPGYIPSFEWLATELDRTAVPMVFHDKPPETDQVVIALDSRFGAELATEHLLAQGYRRIGIITGPLEWWAAKQREIGWRCSMQKAGVNCLQPLKVEGDWSAASGERGFRRLVAQVTDVQAVFACNDQMALGALRAAAQLGLRIPDDLAVVGFDDIPEAAYFSPPLTTVQQSPEALGALAVERMVALVLSQRQGDDLTGDAVLVKPRLVVRSSTLSM